MLKNIIYHVFPFNSILVMNLHSNFGAFSFALFVAAMNTSILVSFKGSSPLPAS